MHSGGNDRDGKSGLMNYVGSRLRGEGYPTTKKVERIKGVWMRKIEGRGGRVEEE